MELTTNYGWSMPEPTDPVNSSAEYAENMESIDGVVKDIADEVTAVDEGLTALATTVAGKVSKAGDTMTGALNMSGSKISGLASPTQANDAATKAYVDNIAGGEYLKLDGSSTMEGDIAMGGHKVTGLPSSGTVNATDAVPKWYMEENAVTYADGLTADLNANNQKISALGTPTFNYDAATKKYVDDTVASIDGFLPITGGDMEGDIAMGGHKVTGLPSSGTINANDAVPKWYMEENAVMYADGLTADLNANSNTISDLAEPVNDSDVATKKYVDDNAGGATLDYSTTEQDTGTKWLDGKSIFQRTFQGSVNTSTTGSSQNTLFQISGVDRMTDIKGFFVYDTRQYPVQYVDNDYRFNARYDRGEMLSTCKSYEGHNASFNLTCFYTKTT